VSAVAEPHDPAPASVGDIGDASVRAHLSIGEVLGALQDDYPDITISKIRFLESQGLLNPERTPSGYRKFYPHDVEQLRWVLRQQKENFLPLKVIKDRLAAGQVDLPPEASGLLDLAPADAGGSGSGDAEVSVPTASAAAAGGASGPAGDRAAATVPSPVAPRPPNRGASAPRPDAAAGGAGEDPPSDAGSKAGPGPSSGSSSGSGGPSPLPEPAGAKGGERRKVKATRTGSPAARLGASGTSVSLVASELCAAAGIPPRLLADLERFGLVAPTSSEGAVVYDEQALATARLAGALGAFGVEPRHLRMYRVAAEREAGLLEQLISARLQTRRPESRAEALADLARINDLTGQFREVQLRSVLGEAFPLD